MVRLALLWHMHQPYYEDLASGAHVLPWVRLHAVKDYWGMVNLLEEFPKVQVTFNLVPSLIVQLNAFAQNRARDRHLEIGLKAAADLEPDEAEWFVANGFHAPYERMIAPHPRYAELHAMKHARKAFDVDQLRDLQVWHKLAWMDPDRLGSDRRLVGLVEQGRQYSEADKRILREVELETIQDVIPAYRRAAERGQIELSTSPFYHPILPLLCDSEAHLAAHPEAKRLRRRFQRPDDARLQIRRSLAFHERTFGRAAHGLWPSEGSVSNEVVAMAGQEKLTWIATDEDILSRSIETPLPRDPSGHAERPELLYRPYRIAIGGAAIRCLFRDHTLSDRIGFAYQSWDAEAAAGDFLERVRQAGRRFEAATGSDGAVVTVILDGENAWEHYAGGGRPFLRALYGRLSESADIASVTMTEAAAAPAGELSRVFSGSWINSDFSIWIGHRDDRRAWDQLTDARDEFDRKADSVPPPVRERALEELLIAEGSDWFWWYGDDHSSDQDRDFDDLFRRHLRNAYQLLGSAAPPELFESNITTAGDWPRLTLRPAGPASPTADGRPTSALEWVSAAWSAIPAGGGGTMHRVDEERLVEGLAVAIDRSALHLLLEGQHLVTAMRDGRLGIELVLAHPSFRVIPVPADWVAIQDLVEARIPAETLGDWDGRFALSLIGTDGQPRERLPGEGFWTLERPKVGAGWVV